MKDKKDVYFEEFLEKDCEHLNLVPYSIFSQLNNYQRRLLKYTEYVSVFKVCLSDLIAGNHQDITNVNNILNSDFQTVEQYFRELPTYNF
jgi:hypothetical protein